MKSLVLQELLQEDGYFVFNNIPVTDEGRPVFEHRFQMRAESIDDQNLDLLHFGYFAHLIPTHISL